MYTITKINERVEQVKAILASKGYPALDFEVEIYPLKKRMAGWASYKYNKIQLSPDYMLHFEEEMLRQIVPHEVVHMYVKKYYPAARQGHGTDFRFMMSLLGLKGDTYHDMHLPGEQTSTKRGTASTMTRPSHSHRIVTARRLVKRYIYVSNTTNRRVQLTHAQHYAMTKGQKTFTSKGESIRYTGVWEMI